MPQDASPGIADADPGAIDARLPQHAAVPGTFQRPTHLEELPCKTAAPRRRRAAHAPDIGKTQIPLIHPNPPRLSELVDGLVQIERSGIFSNYGPMNTRLEKGLVEHVFGGDGACVTVCNATVGLMLAVKQAVGWRPRGRYVLMPSFTFAAAAHAALWCGLTPLLCDIDSETWLPDPGAEERLLERYGHKIALILPNASFGNSLDLTHYDRLSAVYDVPVVIDAAASLGSLDAKGRAFGAGCRHPLVYSMHATKSFATGEAGLIYCADQERIATLRAMGNFGFGQPRSATMPGLNSKLSEVSALLGVAKLQKFKEVAAHRHAAYELYRTLLPQFTFQRMTGQRTAHQFVSILLPRALAGQVPDVIAELGREGIGAGRYFVPHIAEQPFFRRACVSGDLPVTNDISGRVIALPISDVIRPAEVVLVCDTLTRICRERAGGQTARRPKSPAAQTTEAPR
nr:DegT/DnrJ/EryC1/StrS family aminotransferase [Roseomonas rubea]